MLAILSITVPVFLLIGVGFSAVRSGILASADMRSIGAFAINFAFPALLFKTMANPALRSILNADLFTAYVIGSLAAAAIALAIACLILRRPLQQAAILAMAISISNSGMIGYPIAQQTSATTASSLFALYVSIEMMLMLPVLLAIAEFAEHRSDHWAKSIAGTFLRVFKNPLLLAIMAGVMFALLDWQLAKPFARFFDMLAMAAIPVALFFVGGTLAGLKWKGLGHDLGLVVVGKLFLHPLAVFAAFWLLPGQPPAIKAAMIINAGMPTLASLPIFGQKFGQEGIGVAAVLASTVASFFTISLLLWLTAGILPH